MKINFALPNDGKMHRYCLNCLADGVIQVKDGHNNRYHCNACGQTNDRAIYFKDHKVWLDEHKELWHESCGVFVQRSDHKFLFFKRTEFPFALAVPAGHVDAGEDPKVAAARELKEETGLSGELGEIGTASIVGDSCSAGADVHRWHAYLLKLKGSNSDVQILEEGEGALWLSIDEAMRNGLAPGVQKVIEKFRPRLEPQV